MRFPIAWLLPGLAASALLGILAADSCGIAVAQAGGVAIAATAVACAVRRRPALVASCAAATVAALAAAVHAHSLALAALHPPDATFDAAVDGTVRALRSEREWVSLELHDVRAAPFGALPSVPVPARLRMLEAVDTPEGLWLADRREGERIRARVRLAPIRGPRNPGAPDRERAALRRGVGANARLLDARLAAVLGPALPPGIRATLARRLVRAGPGGELLAALAVGDRSEVSPAAREAFRCLGIGHLLAVSGLHLALVAGLSFVAIRRAALGLGGLAETTDVRLLACVLAGLAAVGYALLAGWGVPVRRATVFVLAPGLALSMRRGLAPLQALSGAALWIAVFDPAAVFELGPQLSFVATGALLSDRGARHAGWRRGVRVSATVIAATAPVLTAHGVASTPAGLLGNALAVPWTAAVLLPASLLGAALAALPPSWAVDTLLAGCTWIGDVSSSAVVAAGEWVPLPSAAPVGLSGPIAAGALALASLLARRTPLRVGLAAAATMVAVLTPAAVPGPPPPRIVALDVGQGDAILVQGRDAAMLVDGGWAVPAGADLGRSVVLPALRALGVEHLDAVVATHADLDHSGGLGAVLAGLPVAELWVPNVRDDSLAELIATAGRHGVAVRSRDTGSGTIRVGDLAVEVLWPPAPGRFPDAALGRNDSSLVLRVEVDGTRLLLTGDIGEVAERALLRAGADLRADVLKLPHHGSRRSGTPAFLEAVSAEVALLSAPCSVRSRLPTAEALERAARVDLSVWWTGRDGALWLRPGPVRRSVWGWRRDPHCRPPS